MAEHCEGSATLEVQTKSTKDCVNKVTNNITTALSGRGICKSFGSTHVLQCVDIDVLPGKLTAVVGPSGSGKTTLLSALALIDAPDAGLIAVDETNYSFPMKKNGQFRAPWPEVSTVFQQLFLWPHLTLRRNITLPLCGDGMTSDCSQVEELIDLFELRECIERYPNQASLGQRQRVALVRALALNPRYLLLDEITSALDVEQVSILLQHIADLKKRGIGILLVTHLIGFAKRAADKVVFIDSGEVLEAGDPDILEAPSTERLKRFLSIVESAS